MTKTSWTRTIVDEENNEYDEEEDNEDNEGHECYQGG